MQNKNMPNVIEGSLATPIRPNRKRSKLVVNEKLLTELEHLGGLGLSFEQIHYYFKQEFNEWDVLVKKYPDINLAIQKGLSDKIAFAAAQLWKKVEEGNFKAILFYLKTQGGWREKSDITVSQVAPLLNLPKIVLPIQDPIQAAKIYQQIMIES